MLTNPPRNTIAVSDARFSDTSFMDPNGRVFEWKGDLYRAIHADVFPFYEDFLQSDVFQELEASRKLISADLTGYHLDGFAAVLSHRRIPFPTFCIEWPREMLKAAALVTLDVCLELLNFDATLQDAYPWNILFEGTKPTLVDFTSVVPTHDSYLWIPYQQFCNFFYHPLLLGSARQWPVARRMLMDYLEGIPAGQVQSLLGPLQKLKSPGYPSRIGIPLMVSRLFSSDKLESRVRRLNAKFSVSFTNKTRHSFFRKLQNTISSISFPDSKSAWTAYYQETDFEELQTKKQLFSDLLDRINPESVLDIGSNMGEFSILAAEHGCNVIAMDTDELCISRLYTGATGRDLSIQPLVMDILNPSPAFGWCGKQFPMASERLQADLVCLFAVIHHLVFTRGQNFHRVISAVRAFQKEYALFEFVDREDKMSVRIRRRINFNDAWYNYENFLDALNQEYSSVEFIGEVSPTRRLVLCRI